jgi:hypothetical protein
MRGLGLLISATLAVGLVPLAATPASAAAPGNDEPQGAVVLHLGDRVVQDTSQATTNAQDQALNANCGAPATNASVWYKYSPRVDHVVVMNVKASDYSTGVMVFRGTPSADSLVTCGPGAVGLHARAGKTYYIMAFSDDPNVNGGKLVLSLKKAPPPPRVHISVAKRGVAFHGGGGAARLHGTYSCRHGSFAFLGGTLHQRAGRLKIPAKFTKRLRCNGRHHRWSALVVSDVGTYARGHAWTGVTIFACGIVTCRHDTAGRHHIHLAWARRWQPQRSVQPSSVRTDGPRPLVQRQAQWPGT